MIIEDINFNEMYVNQKKETTFKSKNKESWNLKADGMNKTVHKSMYNEEFLNLINFKDINSLLDIGCGVGNLSLLISPKVKEVYSLDFSSRMLEILDENAKKENIRNIKTINASWYDEWNNVPKADLVIASRCLEVKDMQMALEKLNKQALKKVVLTYKVGGSFLNDDILKVMNKKINKKPDYIYIINILYNMGINASLNFISSEGRSTRYLNVEDFIKSVSWTLGEINEDEKLALEKYYNDNIKDKNSSNDLMKWAIISWDKV